MLRASVVLLLVVLLARPTRADDVPLPIPCPASCESSRFEARAELLVWWLRSGRLPPLVTADSQVIYGNEKIDTNRHLGGRLTVDAWLDDCLGLRVAGFVVERNSRNFDVKSAGEVLIARPYTNAVTGLPAAEVLAGPALQGLRTGGFDGLSKIELFGQEAAVLVPLFDTDTCAITGLAGPYLLQMRERLDFKASSSLAADSSLFGETDRLRVHDRFYGGQVGLESEWRHGPWSLAVSGKAALGMTEQVLKIRGERIEQTPLGRSVSPFGFLARPTNSGTHREDELSFVAEVDVRCGCELADGVRVTAGCTFIRWSHVRRAGEAIDTELSFMSTEIARPLPLLGDDYFWALGVTAGVELLW